MYLIRLKPTGAEETIPLYLVVATEPVQTKSELKSPELKPAEPKEKPKGIRKTATKEKFERIVEKKYEPKATYKRKDDTTLEVRRSSRIRSQMEQRMQHTSRGHGLVETPTPAFVANETQGDIKRIAGTTAVSLGNPSTVVQMDEEIEIELKKFELINNNVYLTGRYTRDEDIMTCSCYLTPEEIERGEFGCGRDCLNRSLKVECGDSCQVGDRCTNKKFQKRQFAPVEVFKTAEKGIGLRAAANIPKGEFVMEYVGEVLNNEQFYFRKYDYAESLNRHYYFMALNANATIDSTAKGNNSRFINHSCDPNSKAEKWSVNGEQRIGLYSIKPIAAGEEITFDYQLENYGIEVPKCRCGTPKCRGWLGKKPKDRDKKEDTEASEIPKIPQDENGEDVQTCPDPVAKSEDEANTYYDIQLGHLNIEFLRAQGYGCSEGCYILGLGSDVFINEGMK